MTALLRSTTIALAIAALAVAALAVPATAANFSIKAKTGHGVSGLQWGGPGHSAKKEPGYPTPGKAAEACGGIDNVFVVYVESPFGNRDHRYDSAA